jgi:LysR family hydrogen peroxide-inducible transcriptional activator
MQYIIVLSEEMQFQKASERCFVSQPTLSMQVKKAEEILGELIFDRSVLPLKITSFGEQVIPIIREILQENDKLSNLALRLKGNLVEEIHVGIIPTVAVYMLPAIFSKLKNSLTNTKIIFEEMKSEEMIIALDQHKIDLGIMAGPHVDLRLESTLLYKEQILVYCPEKEGNILSLEELRGCKPWLLSHGNCLRNQMWEFCELNALVDNFQWDYQGGSIEILMKMVDENGGYTLVPENIELPEDKRKFLKQLEYLQSSPSREIIALFPKRTIKGPFVREIVMTIKRTFPSSSLENLVLLNWK